MSKPFLVYALADHVEGARGVIVQSADEAGALATAMSALRVSDDSPEGRAMRSPLQWTAVAVEDVSTLVIDGSIAAANLAGAINRRRRHD